MQKRKRRNFWPYYYVGRPWKHHGRHQNHESATIPKKMISIYCLTLSTWRPSWILPTMQCPNVRSGHTTRKLENTRKLHGRHQNHESATVLKKMISIYCLTLNIWRPSWIYPQCNVSSIFWPYHYVGRTRKPHGRHQNHKSAAIP